MILVDSSIWIDQLRAPDDRLAGLIRHQIVVMHPFILGEVLLGSLHDRAAVRLALSELDPAPMADDTEVVDMIETARLYGSGVGYVDAHLIASTRLMRGGQLWTRDRRLAAAADRFGIALDNDLH